VNALTKFEAEDGRVLWIDTDASINYSEAPRYFDEVESLDRATHWLNAEEQQLLLAPPMRLVLAKPDGREDECAHDIQVWHHRRSCVLTKNNPTALSGPCARKIDAQQPDKIKDNDNGGAYDDNPMEHQVTLGDAARRAGPPTVEMTALPAGWRERADESGNAYFTSPDGESTWDRPTHAAKHPRGWSAHTVEDGSIYYNNDHTNETTWEKPTLPAPPAGWLVCPNADHGQYYKNIATGEKSWVHPHDTAEVE
jgi:hypothetical protein